MRPGTRVRVTGIPYEGQVGTVARPQGHWEVWVRLDSMTRAVGFTKAECIPLDADEEEATDGV